VTQRIIGMANYQTGELPEEAPIVGIICQDDSMSRTDGLFRLQTLGLPKGFFLKLNRSRLKRILPRRHWIRISALCFQSRFGKAWKSLRFHRSYLRSAFLILLYYIVVFEVSSVFWNFFELVLKLNLKSLSALPMLLIFRQYITPDSIQKPTQNTLKAAEALSQT
jgi:hypothetical protein